MRSALEKSHRTAEKAQKAKSLLCGSFFNDGIHDTLEPLTGFDKPVMGSGGAQANSDPLAQR
jgi:hypothetical protein